MLIDSWNGIYHTFLPSFKTKKYLKYISQIRRSGIHQLLVGMCAYKATGVHTKHVYGPQCLYQANGKKSVLLA